VRKPRFRAPGSAAPRKDGPLDTSATVPSKAQLGELCALLRPLLAPGCLCKLVTEDAFTRTRVEIWPAGVGSVRGTTYANPEIEAMGECWAADVMRRLGFG